jgi:hypothetical protein
MTRWLALDRGASSDVADNPPATTPSPTASVRFGELGPSLLATSLANAPARRVPMESDSQE